ncbi:MAG: oligosaccharide flippase family protein [Candidatus Latescibacteria bacterium]|nr:oligosaccharide flippase family protein [Candidatus Latescibacterota bacterium]
MTLLLKREMTRDVAHHDARVIAKGAGVNVLGNLAKLVRPMSSILMTRLFGVEVFGLYTLGWSVIDLLSKVGLFGLDKGVVKFVVRYRSDGNDDAVYRTLGQSLLIGLIVSMGMATLLSVIAPLLSSHVFSKPELTSMLRVLACSIPFFTFSHVLLAATKALKIMRFDAYVRSIAEPVVMLAAVCLCFVVGWRVNGIAIAHLTAAIGGAACAWYCFRRVFSSSACVTGIREMKLWTEVTQFSLPVMCYDVLYILMMRLDALMLGHFLPAVQVGIYGVAIEVALLTKKVRQWFEPIFTPIIAEFHYRQETERLEATFILVTRWIMTVNIACFFGIVLIGRDVLTVFGPVFAAGALSLTLLSLSQVIYGSMGSGDTVLLMAGHPYLNLLNTGLVLVLNGLLGFLLIPRYGIVGAAVGTLLSFTAMTILRLIEVSTLLHISPFRRQLVKPIMAGSFAFMTALAVRSVFLGSGLLSLLACPTLFITLYGVTLVVLRLPDEDQRLLRLGWSWLSSRIQGRHHEDAAVSDSREMRRPPC